MRKYLLPNDGSFYKANLHCHSTVSDGVLTPNEIKEKYINAMDDDLNTPVVIAYLFDACKYINQATDGLITLNAEDIAKLRHLFDVFVGEILGVKMSGESADSGNNKAYEQAVDLLMEIRANAKANKDWATSDLIRDKMAAFGFNIKDTKNGVEWSLK